MAGALGSQAGGIRSLRFLIRRHGRALEADLRSEYGVRLRDLHTGDMTWRELATYVQGLSSQARIRSILNDGRLEPTGEQVLLADVYDAVRQLTWTLQSVNTPEKTKAPKVPKPYPRWWLAPSKSKEDKAARADRLDAARERRRERQRAIAEGRIA